MLQNNELILIRVLIQKSDATTDIHVFLHAFYLQRNKIDQSYIVSTYEWSY